MRKKTAIPLDAQIKEQAARALLKSVDVFLRRSGIPRKSVGPVRSPRSGKDNTVVHYQKSMRAYENMGVLMATWFSDPQFLDKLGNPIPLSGSTGPRSIAALICRARVRISKKVALEFLRLSPSINSSRGSFVPLRRVFVLPEFELPRAAILVERYLDTLVRNSVGRKRGATLLLERSCYVPEVDLRAISPILRDMKERGTAFMDSTDGEIEACRLRRPHRTRSGEVGVVVFAWTKAKSRSRAE